LHESSLEECLRVVDAEEHSVKGDYQRVEVETESGVRVWAYQVGEGLELTPIASGDWLRHMRPRKVNAKL
jgi:gamma-glutamylcyclotransferase (GGCT)/AIG2-like uncharacterized protein YtfP